MDFYNLLFPKLNFFNKKKKEKQEDYFEYLKRTDISDDKKEIKILQILNKTIIKNNDLINQLQEESKSGIEQGGYFVYNLGKLKFRRIDNQSNKIGQISPDFLNRLKGDEILYFFHTHPGSRLATNQAEHEIRPTPKIMHSGPDLSGFKLWTLNHNLPQGLSVNDLKSGTGSLVDSIEKRYALIIFDEYLFRNFDYRLWEEFIVLVGKYNTALNKRWEASDDLIEELDEEIKLSKNLIVNFYLHHKSYSGFRYYETIENNLLEFTELTEIE